MPQKCYGKEKETYLMQLLFLGILFLVLLALVLLSIKFLKEVGLYISASLLTVIMIVIGIHYTFTLSGIVVSTSAVVYMLLAFILLWGSLFYGQKVVIKTAIISAVSMLCVCFSMLIGEICREYGVEGGTVDWVQDFRDIGAQCVVIILLTSAVFLLKYLKTNRIVKAIILLVGISLIDGFIFKGIAYSWEGKNYLLAVGVDVAIKIVCSMVLMIPICLPTQLKLTASES